MAGADPSYTAKWVQQFPEGPVREHAEEKLVQNWARQDPQAADNWLASLPAGGNRDTAARQFAESASAAEPQLAWAWAMTIKDPLKQLEALERVAPNYLRLNGTDARTAIQNSGLPPELQARLLKPKD
jgi:hypothetical protein